MHHFFEVCGRCEGDIERFMNEANATDISIEDGWHLPVDNCLIGFGFTNMTLKQLNRLADWHGLQLVFVERVSVQ